MGSRSLISVAAQYALTITADDILHTCAEQDAAAGHARRAHAIDHYANLRKVFADNAQGIHQCGQHHDSRAMLIIMKDRDVQALFETILHDKAARAGDILQVDAAKAGTDVHTVSTISSGSVVARQSGKGVDAAKLLEQHGFAFHHRHRRGGPNVAQPQHRRPVGDHGHGVALDRQRVGPGRILGDGPADPCHTGRVDHREVIARLDRKAALHLDLAAKMHQERAVADVNHADTGQLAQAAHDMLPMHVVTRIDSDVAHHQPAVGTHDVDSADVPPSCPIVEASRPSIPGLLSISHRTVRL